MKKNDKKVEYNIHQKYSMHNQWLNDMIRKAQNFIILEQRVGGRIMENEKKTIVLQKEGTQQSKIFPHVLSVNQPLVDLSFITKNIQNANHHLFKIYSPEKDIYIPFEEISNENFLIPRRYLELAVIMIRYSDDITVIPEETDSVSSSNQKKQRSKERTIGEVVELVREWRELHSGTQDQKRMNLQEAARSIGVSKKSLDDYYYQLRVGEKHGFDFTAHFYDKIGVLRAFIKEHQPEKRVKDRNAKHPRKLKIIDQFSQKLSLKEPELQSQEKSVSIQIEQQPEESLNFWRSPFSSISAESLNNCQNNFLKDFQYQLDQPNDPFVSFNFRKKSLQDESPNFYFRQL